MRDIVHDFKYILGEALHYQINRIRNRYENHTGFLTRGIEFCSRPLIR